MSNITGLDMKCYWAFSVIIVADQLKNGRCLGHSTCQIIASLPSRLTPLGRQRAAVQTPEPSLVFLLLTLFPLLSRHVLCLPPMTARCLSFCHHFRVYVVSVAAVSKAVVTSRLLSVEAVCYRHRALSAA